jgi:acyl-CoA hydrolase
MTAVDVNLYGTVHGGVVMKFMDDVAGAVAARHCGGTAVTAAIDEIVFAEPIRVGDLVHAHAQVNWTGSTSLEVGVAVVAERWDTAGAVPVTVATAYLVFVAVDARGRPRPVPPVRPESAIDARRFREAGIRRAHRLARRAAIEQDRATPDAAGPAGTAADAAGPAGTAADGRR